MANQNGQLILQTLKTFKEPVPVSQIVMHIADTAGVTASAVKHEVQETVENGVRFGFLQRKNRRYYTAPIEGYKMSSDVLPEESRSQKRRYNRSQSRSRSRKN